MSNFQITKNVFQIDTLRILQAKNQLHVKTVANMSFFAAKKVFA